MPIRLNELLEKAVEQGVYASKSDLIREAVREKLQKMGFKLETLANLNG